MRLLALCLIATLAVAADPAPTPPALVDQLPVGYYVIDAAVALPVQSKRVDDMSPVRRYHMKDPRLLSLGGRTFIIGDGIRGWQTNGSVIVPVDEVVAMGRFVNNVEYARYNDREVEIGTGLKQ